MNREKREKAALTQKGFCFILTPALLGKAIGASKGKYSLRGIIRFGNTLNKREWVEAETKKGSVVQLTNHATEALIF